MFNNVEWYLVTTWFEEKKQPLRRMDIADIRQVMYLPSTWYWLGYLLLRRTHDFSDFQL